MGNNQKYSIDLKLQVVGKYKQGICGYKKLAREFNLSRDTVHAWCLDPKLQSATQMAKKNKINNDKNLEYYKTAAIFWEQYAGSIENNLHWVLDTVFDEDYCRVRKDNGAQNLNIIRKLVMNLLKGLDLPITTKKKNLTIGNKQTLCLRNEKCLLYALQNL